MLQFEVFVVKLFSVYTYSIHNDGSQRKSQKSAREYFLFVPPKILLGVSSDPGFSIRPGNDTRNVEFDFQKLSKFSYFQLNLFFLFCVIALTGAWRVAYIITQ